MSEEVNRLDSHNTIDAKVSLPTPSGPHLVGVMDTEFGDTQRVEPYAPNENRRIPARIWYPADSVSGKPRPYAKPQELEHQVRHFCTKILKLDPKVAEVFDVSTHAYENAPVADIGKCPTLIFSHGGYSYLQQNTALMEHLASHGYLVISISHLYFSCGSIYADGTIAGFADDALERSYQMAAKPGYMEQFFDQDVSRRFETHLGVCEGGVHPLAAPVYQVWQQDVVHVIDRLFADPLPENMEPLRAQLDINRIGTFGKSMGACATVAAYGDDRVKATVNLDGGQFDSSITDVDLGIPALIMHSDHSLHMPGQSMSPHSEFAYEKFETMGLNEQIIRVQTPGISHIGFSDFCLIPETLRAAAPAVAAVTGSMDGERMTTMMNDFVKAFFDKYLLDQGPGIGAELRDKYPETTDVDLSYIREWAASSPKPDFMSHSHIFAMNRRAASAPEVKAEVAKLERKYVIAFELSRLDDENPVWWKLNFDPHNGFSFDRREPESTPDIVRKGDFEEYMAFATAMSKGEAKVEDEPVTNYGDMSVMKKIEAAFQKAQKACAVPVNFPQV